MAPDTKGTLEARARARLVVCRDLTDDAQRDCEIIRELLSVLHVTEVILAERQLLLDAIPTCELHGSNCVPHAIRWINDQIRKHHVSQR